MGEALMPKRIGGKNGIVDVLIAEDGNDPGGVMFSEHFNVVERRLKDDGLDPDDYYSYAYRWPTIFIYNFDAYGMDGGYFAPPPDGYRTELPNIVALLVETNRDDWTQTVTLIVSADGVNFEMLKEITDDPHCACYENFNFRFESPEVGNWLYLDDSAFEETPQYRFKPNTEYNCIIVK